MSAKPRHQALRPIVAAQGVLGAAIAARPDVAVAAVCGDGARPASWLVRLLGVRMAVQAIVTTAFPTACRGGAVVDATHALSMMAVAWRMPAYRRPALASAVIASASAVGVGVLTR